MKKLSIIIPAYNEENAIQAIIERVLSAKKAIIEKSQLEGVEVIVVNDGSTDRTGDIAGEYARNRRIQMISYEKNRGYGAAIKLGFESSSGELVSFLDADGTCDPLFFIHLLKKMKETHVDVVIGSRLNPESQMPLTRKIGNILYRVLVRLISGSRVTDVASGMRIIRKESLRKLYPLPDGLHFTPAMSVRAILDHDLKIEEVPMPYRERIGPSKLSVFKDGIRFLKVILEIAFTYRPLRLLGVPGIFLLIIACILGAGLLMRDTLQGQLSAFSFLISLVMITLGFAGIQCILTGIIAQAIVHRLRDRASIPSARSLKYIGWFSILIALVLGYAPFSHFIAEGRFSVHWSYLAASVFLLFVGLQILVFSMIPRMVTLLREHIESRLG